MIIQSSTATEFPPASLGRVVWTMRSLYSCTSLTILSGATHIYACGYLRLDMYIYIYIYVCLRVRLCLNTISHAQMKHKCKYTIVTQQDIYIVILSYSIYAIYVSIPLLSYYDSYGICTYDLHYGNHIKNNPLKSYHIFAIYQFPSIKHIGWYLPSTIHYQSWSVNHYPLFIHQPIITHLSITAIYPPLSIYHYHQSLIHGLSINQSINH